MDKPVKQINNIINAFACSTDIVSRVMVYNRGSDCQKVMQNEKVLIIIEGVLGLQRRSDNILIGTIKGPYVIFLLPEIIIDDYILSEESQFSYMLYGRSEFFNMIAALNMWEDLYHIMQYTASRLNIKLQAMLPCDLYSVVKYYLNEINSNPDLKAHVNVCDYITKRSGFSKSGTMMILSELKKGNYIDIDRGRLKKIKILPSRF